MDLGLDERVAIVTGGANGIGAACARALAAEGCRVLVVDRSPAPRPTGVAPDRFHSIIADISTEDGATSAVDAAVGRFGRLDVLVACAGVYETGAVSEVDAAEFDRVLGINARGAYLCARAVLPVLVDRGWGRVILFGSMAADTGGRVAAGPAYVASKAAVLGLTRSLAHVGGPHGVTVNCVVPGLIDTPMTAVMPDTAKRAAILGTPMRRVGTSDDVAAAVVMLASEPLGFVSGAHVDVNGGLVMT